MQLYKCLNCRKRFQNKKRNDIFQKKLLNEFIWQRQTYTDLANKYGKSKKWIQQQLDEVKTESIVKLNPQPLVVVADVTFFSRLNGLCVFREPALKNNIWWKFVDYERIRVYEQGRKHLERNGFTITAIVLDGKPGVRKAFEGIPVQMCHFHQKQIIRRHLTLNPKLEANIELKVIVATLANTNEEIFTEQLNDWHKKWKDFLKEKTTDSETSKWYYTHKKLRSAHNSLKKNLPYLFTYQRYPELNIPNTTNSLDGYFNVLKGKLNVHRGLNKKRAKKVIIELLKGAK